MPFEGKRNTDRNTVNPNALLHKFDQFKVLDGETQEWKKLQNRIVLHKKERKLWRT